jgi:ABC-2 type transport system permease protein
VTRRQHQSSALAVLVRIRLAQIVRQPSGAFWFFALPLLLLGLAMGLFDRGHPFERRHLAITSDGLDVRNALDAYVRTGGLAIDVVPDETRGRARLDTRVLSAVVVTEPSRTRVLVGERDALFGRGVAAAIGGPAVLEIVPVAPNGYVRFLVPGMLAQGIVVAGLFGMGSAMVRYRQSRFLRKLATTPLSRGDFVLSQILARTVLVLLQLLVLLVFARLVLHLPFDVAAIGWVLLVGAAGLVTFMGVGFVVSCLVTTEDLAVDVINALTIPIALLSEIFFSTDELPRPLAWLSSALPSTQMVRAMRAVLLHGDEPGAAVFPALAILGAWALVSYAVAVRTFQWR